MDAILRLWEKNKKHSSIVLVFDVSGSMNNKIHHAREGSVELVRAMHDADDFSLLPFHNALKQVRNALEHEETPNAAASE
jgi:hypothetical protein